MDERAALAMLADQLEHAGDDAAWIDGLVLTTDMLHERTDFPAGVTPYTMGWRAVGASLSDVAAMGASAIATVAVYAAPTFEPEALSRFVTGASEVSRLVDAAYVGGDLDHHDELTVVSTAVGRTDDPVLRSGASPGDGVFVTGRFGRTAAALRLFEDEEIERGNELFRFHPRVGAGCRLAGHATAMMDSSDGLARSLHQLADASDCGFRIDGSAIPVHPAVEEVAQDRTDRDELARFVGEDFELVCTGPAAIADLDCPVTRIGDVTSAGVRLDDEPLPDRGYVH